MELPSAFLKVSAAAWIFIDHSSMDIKTILGNKMSGCGSDALGFALYVNEWEKNDGKLWLEWGSGTNGCEKVWGMYVSIFVHRRSIFIWKLHWTHVTIDIETVRDAT